MFSKRLRLVHALVLLYFFFPICGFFRFFLPFTLNLHRSTDSGVGGTLKVSHAHSGKSGAASETGAECSAAGQLH